MYEFVWARDVECSRGTPEDYVPQSHREGLCGHAA